MIKPLAYFLSSSRVGSVKKVPLELYVNGEKYGEGTLHFSSRYSTISHHFKLEYGWGNQKFNLRFDDAVALNGMPRQQYMSLTQNGRTEFAKEFVYVPEQTLIYDHTSRVKRPHDVPAPEGFEVAQKHKTWFITFTPSSNDRNRYIEIEPESEKWVSALRRYRGRATITSHYTDLELHTMSHESPLASGGMIRDQFRHRYSAFNLHSGLWELVSTPLHQIVPLKALRDALPEVSALNKSYEPLEINSLPLSLLI